MSRTDTITELAKRRGFFFGTAEAYGGVAGFSTFGPKGATLKRNVENAWRSRFTIKENNHEVEAPTILPEPVFDASGHLETFNDMLVRCAECSESHRADHLVEDATDIEEAESVPIPEIEELIREADIQCPSCGAALAGEPVEEFNLMFKTTIGPGSEQPGYLRPETAQGIFVEFPRLKEYARNQLPFAVTQIGRAYRNEISPRKGLIRVRELTQAELEQFVDPERDEPPLEEVADVSLVLYPASEQEREVGGEHRRLTVAEAVAEGVIASPWVAYYLGMAQRWYERIGVDPDRFRFRQHQSGELSHYASDCWDAEAAIDAPVSGGRDGEADVDWIEVAGFAYRGEYDLSKHGEASDDSFTVFRRYDQPRTVERPSVDPDMSVLGPEFGGQAGEVAETLERLAERNPEAFDAEKVTIELDGETIQLDASVANFDVKEVTETGEHITPHVVEPSFGIDRLVYTLLDHGYREDEVDGETRSYLALDPEIAPTDAAVFPLVSNDERLVELADRVTSELRNAGLDIETDDSGSIGRRYRRQDEVGTPYCITVDRDGIETDGTQTVTLRERDTARQLRLPADDLVQELTALLDHETDTGFSDLEARYETVGTGVDRA